MNDNRSTIIAGLRDAADMLASTECPDPTHYSSDYQGRTVLQWLLFANAELDEQKSTAADIVRAIGGKWDKDARPLDLFRFTQDCGTFRLEVTVARSAVCEYVVTGSEQVTEQVPDPDVQVPLVEVTRTVEQGEWRCAPLLTAVAS